ncbi:SDR family NAD(P)-dependent oxidoreductase [Octadecabacter sp.]|nr:SDR family NAD(P)-dependent oxidoreductase [Octadecabacter sp.]
MIKANATHGKIAAVTGGTGFLGRFIVAALTRSGWTVRMLVRSEPLHPLTPDLDAEIILGDLSDTAALERLCAGADAVIHAAGLIKAKNRDDFFKVNVNGSAKIATASAKISPDARFIVVSSMAAREPMLSDYAASKRAGEDAVLENSAGPVTILRPSAIYGLWDRETFPLFQMAAKGVVFGPNADAARICLVNAVDVSEAVVAFADNGGAQTIYEVTDDRVDGYSWTEIVKVAGKVLKTRPRLVKIPTSLLKSGAFFSQLVSHGTGRNPILTQGKVREILHGDWSSSPAMQPPKDVWSPRINLADGFSDTAEWYRKEKWL